LFGAAVFSFAASGLAFAADIAVKAPPSPPPAPVYNWTGFYVGGNIGASFGTFKTDFNATPVTVAATGVGTCTVATPCTFTAPGLAGRDEVYPAGFIGGAQIGYNWQFSPYGLWGLRPISKVPTKESTVLLPRISVAPSLLLWGGLPA